MIDIRHFAYGNGRNGSEAITSSTLTDADVLLRMFIEDGLLHSSKYRPNTTLECRILLYKYLILKYSCLL